MLLTPNGGNEGLRRLRNSFNYLVRGSIIRDAGKPTGFEIETILPIGQ